LFCSGRTERIQFNSVLLTGTAKLLKTMR